MEFHQILNLNLNFKLLKSMTFLILPPFGVCEASLFTKIFYMNRCNINRTNVYKKNMFKGLWCTQKNGKRILPNHS